jgi:hypothetical protein
MSATIQDTFLVILVCVFNLNKDSIVYRTGFLFVQRVSVTGDSFPLATQDLLQALCVIIDIMQLSEPKWGYVTCCRHCITVLHLIGFCSRLCYITYSYQFTAPGDHVGRPQLPLATTEDVQKKISLLGKSSTIAGELFPHYSADHDLVARGEGKRGRTGVVTREGSGLVVVASMVSKIPNQGGEPHFLYFPRYINSLAAGTQRDTPVVCFV